MTEKPRPEPARREPACESFDYINARLREIEADKKRQREAIDVAGKMAESALPVMTDCRVALSGDAVFGYTEAEFREMARRSAEWQAEWERLYRESHWL